MAEAELRRSPWKTRGLALSAVATELRERGYTVSLKTEDRTLLAALKVVSPLNSQVFLIDVKSLWRPNSWTTGKRPSHADFFVCAFVPEDEPHRFFVASRQQIDNYAAIELVRMGRTPDYKWSGILWETVFPHENAWDIFPA